MNKKVVILNDGGFDTGSFFRHKEETIELKKQEEKDKFLLENAPKKRGRKKRTRMYFTQDTEDAIVKYNNEENFKIRHKIYEQNIQFSIEKLAENIINTFKFGYIKEQYQDIKVEVVSKMLIEMNKYDQSKGKAFSYFSIIAKNHLIIANNESYKEMKVTRSIESRKEDGMDYDIVDSEFDDNIKNTEIAEFIRLMVDYWEINITLVFKKDRDIEIAYAVMELFRNVNSLEFFNKKALYLLVREMTGHKTQYITRVINKMMIYYPTIKNMYYTTGTISEEPFFKAKKK
jgi:hypothetical protein